MEQPLRVNRFAESMPGRRASRAAAPGAGRLGEEIAQHGLGVTGSSRRPCLQGRAPQRRHSTFRHKSARSWPPSTRKWLLNARCRPTGAAPSGVAPSRPPNQLLPGRGATQEPWRQGAIILRAHRCPQAQPRGGGGGVGGGGAGGGGVSASGCQGCLGPASRGPPCMAISLAMCAGFLAMILTMFSAKHRPSWRASLGWLRPGPAANAFQASGGEMRASTSPQLELPVGTVGGRMARSTGRRARAAVAGPGPHGPGPPAVADRAFPGLAAPSPACSRAPASGRAGAP